MLMDRQTITVDIAPGSGPIQRIRLSQGDIGRQLGVYIIQNGAAVDCSGYSAHLYVLKPDKNYYEKTCSISSNLISWETAEQETPLAGECKAQIRITDNGMDIGTANFIEAIEATPAAGGTASESLISSMTQYVDAAESAARTAVAAEDTVEDIISTYSGIPGRVTNAENSLAATQDGLAIMANGNTHAAIAAGQAVFVRNHSSLSEGLYWASTSIATNATLSTSNLTADTSGGLNKLKGDIDSLNSNINTLGVILTGDKNSAAFSVPDNTATLVSSIVLTKGVWIVVGCADWESNENGYRQIAFDSEALNPGRNTSSTTQGISSKEAYQQIVFLKMTNGETMNMYARQTSGSSLNLYPYLYATKVGL